MKWKNYWRYLFISTWPLTLAMAVISLVCFPSAAISTVYPLSTDYVPYPGLSYATFLLCAFAYVLPLYYRSKMMSRQKTDFFLSLPLTRVEIAVSDFLHGFLQIVVAWSLGFFVGISIYAMKGLPYQYGYFMYYYGIILALGFVIYACSYGVSCLANNILDGFILVILSILVPFLLCLGPTLFVSDLISYYEMPRPSDELYSLLNPTSWSLPYLADSLTASFNQASAGRGLSWNASLFALIQIPFYFAVAGAGFYHLVHWKAEEGGSLTTSKLAYPFALGIYVLTMTYYLFHGGVASLFSSVYLDIVGGAIVSIVFFVLFFLSKRKIGWYWKDAIYYFSLLAVAVLFSLIMLKGLSI
jgi:hypothetical protein